MFQRTKHLSANRRHARHTWLIVHAESEKRARSSGISRRESLVVLLSTARPLCHRPGLLGYMYQLKIFDLGPNLMVAYESLQTSHL